MPESLDRPLEKEPRVKVVIPKPEPRGEDQDPIDYETALDGLSVLDKQNKSKYFGFYGRGECFYQKAISYSCEDHRLRIANDDPMEQRSQKAKDEFIQRKNVLADQVRASDKDEMSYDDLITDIIELLVKLLLGTMKLSV